MCLWLDLLLLKCQREQRLTTTPSTATAAVPTIRVDEPDTDDDEDDDDDDDDDEDDDASDNDNDDDKDDSQSVQDTGVWLFLIRFYVTMLCMNFHNCVRHFLTILSILFASKLRQASTRFGVKSLTYSLSLTLVLCSTECTHLFLQKQTPTSTMTCGPVEQT